jgi:hypothetical protein
LIVKNLQLSLINFKVKSDLNMLARIKGWRIFQRIFEVFQLPILLVFRAHSYGLNISLAGNNLDKAVPLVSNSTYDK